MNLQQIEYIVAVDTYRHFVTAAEKCFVTQATLSMMIKKMEDELSVKIFDRSKQPVQPTEIGKKLIAQARVVLQESRRLAEIVKQELNEFKGELKIGIIPTLAPYVVPLFITSFLKKYPHVRLKIFELTTPEITEKLEQQALDIGLLALPLNKPTLREEPLFYEEFVLYTSVNEKALKNKYIVPKDIDANRLWLLEEGHCLRSQVINLCGLKNKEKQLHQLDFETGSIETLKKLVDTNSGITILPELALKDMTGDQLKRVKYFKKPSPGREIGIVTYRYFLKENLVNVLRSEIVNALPKQIKDNAAPALR